MHQDNRASHVKASKSRKPWAEDWSRRYARTCCTNHTRACCPAHTDRVSQARPDWVQGNSLHSFARICWSALLQWWQTGDSNQLTSPVLVTCGPHSVSWGGNNGRRESYRPVRSAKCRDQLRCSCCFEYGCCYSATHHSPKNMYDFWCFFWLHHLMVSSICKQIFDASWVLFHVFHNLRFTEFISAILNLCLRRSDSFDRVIFCTKTVETLSTPKNSVLKTSWHIATVTPTHTFLVNRTITC